MSSDDSELVRPPDGATEPQAVRKITDAQTMRALAHPVRIALYEELARGGTMGTMTATEAGERIGESPTTCSFHLRQLAKYGFVEEAGGGKGRARPWRLTSIGMSLSPGGDPEAQIASDAALHVFRERQFARYHAWRETKAAYPAKWREAANDSGYVFYLTAEEMEQLNSEVGELLMRWFRLEGRKEDPSRRPPGSAPVEMLLLAYPTAPPRPGGDGEQPAERDA